MLVVGAGLFGRAMQRAAVLDPGFDPHGVELATLDLALAGYDEARGRMFATDLITACAHAARRAVGRARGDGAARRRRARPGWAGGSGRRAARGPALLRCRLERRVARLLRDDEAGARNGTGLHRRGPRRYAVSRDRQRDCGAAMVAGPGAPSARRCCNRTAGPMLPMPSAG